MLTIFIIACCLTVVLIVSTFCEYRSIKKAREAFSRKFHSEIRPANGAGSEDRLCGPRTIASLSCGAKVVQLEPHDVDALATPYFDDQPESVREGGAFFQCYPRCPYILDCPRQKALAGFHLGEDVRVPLENGLCLELQRGDGHRRVAVVGDPDVEFEPVALAGVTFLAGGKRYTTVPPLMQQVEHFKKDVEQEIHAGNPTTRQEGAQA